jgi:hypothetical protein
MISIEETLQKTNFPESCERVKIHVNRELAAFTEKPDFKHYSGSRVVCDTPNCKGARLCAPTDVPHPTENSHTTSTLS